MSEKQQDERIELKTQEIELPKVDISKHVGKKFKIADVGTYKGRHGEYVKFETDIIETIEGGKEDINVKASVIFGLHEDKNGNIGWGKDTKLGQFLKKYNAKKLLDMVGKECLVQIKRGKDGQEFLTIV